MSQLAQVPELGAYINPVKVVVVIAMLFGWTAAATWIDRDTNVVKTRREQWNVFVLSGGFVAFLVLFLLPWSGSLFAVGMGFSAVIAGASMVGYVIHRNGRTVPDARVLTLGHVKRLLGRDGGKTVSSKGFRVQITDHAGGFVDTPDDPEGARDFDAIQEFLHDVIRRRASQVDIIAGKEKYRLIHKVDGVVSERKQGLPVAEGERILRYLKQLAGLNAEEIRRPQHGTIRVTLLSDDKKGGMTEVHTSGTTQGERMRLTVQAGPVLVRIHELGIAGSRLEGIKQCLAKSHGLLITSSPPGHGLTTTQYAILRSHDAYINNIHALERKLLVDVDNITQQLFDSDDTEQDYSRALQAVLRREPDIVLVDVCEDAETAVMAARAAAADRKIYLGMHAKDCFDALHRFRSWVADPALVSQSLLGIINQRLVRVLCEECREAFRPDPATLKKLNMPADKIERFYRPPPEPRLDKRGREIVCPHCQGTGYVGRAGLFEFLRVDDAVAKILAAGAPIERIKTQCRKNKMYYLQEEGLLKVIDGTTSMNEVLRCLRDSEKKK